MSKIADLTREILFSHVQKFLCVFITRDLRQFCIHAEKDHLYFYKNSTNQTLIFNSSKVVYFRSISNIKYSTLKKRSLHCHKMSCMTARQLSFQQEKWRSHSGLI